jgi:hypothetical protein
MTLKEFTKWILIIVIGAAAGFTVASLLPRDMRM